MVRLWICYLPFDMLVSNVSKNGMSFVSCFQRLGFAQNPCHCGTTNLSLNILEFTLESQTFYSKVIRQQIQLSYRFIFHFVCHFLVVIGGHGILTNLLCNFCFHFSRFTQKSGAPEDLFIKKVCINSVHSLINEGKWH